MTTQLNLNDEPDPDRRVTPERREEPPSRWGDLTTVANFIIRVGVPNAIALFFVYWVTMQMSTSLAAHAAESRRDSLRLLRVLQQICVNTAPDAAARERCLSWSFDEVK